MRTEKSQPTPSYALKNKVAEKRQRANQRAIPTKKNKTENKSSPTSPSAKEPRTSFSRYLSLGSLIISAIAIILSLYSNRMSNDANNIARKANDLSGDSNKIANAANLLALQANGLIKESNQYLEKQTNPNLETAQSYTVPGWALGPTDVTCTVFMRIINSGGVTETISANNAIISYRGLTAYLDSPSGMPMLEPRGNTKSIMGIYFVLTLSIAKTVSITEQNNANDLWLPFQLEPQNSIDVIADLNFSFDKSNSAQIDTNYIGISQSVPDGYYPLTITLIFETLSKKDLISPPMYCISMK